MSVYKQRRWRRSPHTVMQLVLRAVLVLGLASLMCAARKDRGLKIVGVVLDPSVSPEIGETSTSSIANMSLSPWTYRVSLDESRFPQRLAQAQCLTSHCLSLQGPGEDAALEARPIHYQVLVLRRRLNKKGKKKKKKKKKNHFILATEMLTVGCTCVKPSVQPQQ